MTNDPTDPPEDTLTDAINAGEYDPPIVVDSMVDYWRGTLPSNAPRGFGKLANLYVAAVQTEDFPAHVQGIADGESLLEDIRTAWNTYNAGPDAQLSPAIAPAGPLVGGQWPDPPDSFALQDVGTNGPDPSLADQYQYDYLRLYARSECHWKWCAFLTRCKGSLYRVLNKGWRIPNTPFPTDLTLMVPYSYKSSWQRVNAYMLDSDIKQYVENNTNILHTAEMMDQDIADFVAAAGVTMPEVTTTTVGDRFPVSKAWWCGELAEWGHVNPADDTPAALNTVAISKSFRAHASTFRLQVGTAIKQYLAYQAQNKITNLRNTENSATK